MKVVAAILAVLAILHIGGCSRGSESTPVTDISSSRTQPSTSHQSESVIADIPQAGWEQIFFKTIDEVAMSAGEEKLRSKKIKASDIELRVWVGFGMSTLRGFILKRMNDRWSAFSIEEHYDKRRPQIDELTEPSIGWTAAWNKLLDNRILSLPDGESIECSPGVDDGFSYVVEVKKGMSYRTYMYDNPQHEKNSCPEAKQVLAIAEMIKTDYRGFPILD